MFKYRVHDEKNNRAHVKTDSTSSTDDEGHKLIEEIIAELRGSRAREFDIAWKIAETDKFVFMEFEFISKTEKGKQVVLEPNDLKHIVGSLENLNEIKPHNLRGRGVVISGRGPIWLYSALVHNLHYAPWVATYDPRLGGGVVVASHTKEHDIGDVIPIDYNSLSFRTYEL